MRKLILLIVVVAAALLLAVPRIVGALAQRQVDDYVASLNSAAATGSGPQITAHSYDRGWFEAHSSQRIALNEGSDDAPVFLVVDSRIEHGLILDDSSPGLGLAEVFSRFSLVDEDERVELPLTATTRIHLNGAASSFVSGETIDHRFDESGSRLRWDGGEMRLDIGAGGSSIAATGSFGQLQIDQDENSLTFGPMQLAGDQRLSTHQLWLGASNLSIEKFAVADPATGSFQVEDFDFFSDARLDGERLAYAFVAEAARITTPEFDDGQLRISMELSDLHAELAAGLRDKYARQDSVAAASGPGWAEIEADMLDLLAQGGRLDIEKFFIATEDGRLDASAQLVVASDAGAPVLVELLMALKGEIDLVVSKALLAAAAENNPQLAQAASMLFKAGYLLEENDDFVLKAAYTGGLLTINGLPLPLPLPVR